MKLLDRILAKLKQRYRANTLEREKTEVLLFMLEPTYIDSFPPGLAHIDERQKYKKCLTETYSYRYGDDLLAQKQNFIDKYTFHEQQQFQYFTDNRDEDITEFRIRAWYEHEQIERQTAQKAWHIVAKRNYHRHMREKFTSSQNQHF